MSDIFDELRAALWSVWHRRWLAVAAAWGVCLLGWAAVSLIPNTYESKARVYVDVEDVLSKQLGIAGDGKEQIMRVRQTLSSAKNLEKVITSTRLGEGITERGALDAATAELEKKVKVTSEVSPAINALSASVTVAVGSSVSTAKLAEAAVPVPALPAISARPVRLMLMAFVASSTFAVGVKVAV